MSGKFALIIGNSRYDDASLGRLKAPDIDVHELEGVLKSPEVGRFDEVVTLLNQDCASVRKAIARFYDQRQRDDLLLLYFSGHGVKDEQGHLYLALRDTESGLLAGSAIETAFITGRMDRSFSKRQVLVLDCCHSGAFAHGAKAAQGVSVGTAEAFEGTGLGRVVLTATDSTQYAWEGDQVIGDAQNSLFTHFLIEGLKTGAADKDEDGVVTVDELYDYVREQVLTTTPRQTPQKWSYLQRGAIVLAQNPFANRSVLPAEIEEAINSKLSGLRLEAVGHLEALLHGHHAGRAHAALEALKALSLDDSRKVANAAAQVLKTQGESRETSEPVCRVETGHRRRSRSCPPVRHLHQLRARGSRKGEGPGQRAHGARVEGVVGQKNRAWRSLRRRHRARARHLQVRDRAVVEQLGPCHVGEKRSAAGGEAQGPAADSHRRRRDAAGIRKPPGGRSHVLEGHRRTSRARSHCRKSPGAVADSDREPCARRRRAGAREMPRPAGGRPRWRVSNSFVRHTTWSLVRSLSCAPTARGSNGSVRRPSNERRQPRASSGSA